MWEVFWILGSFLDSEKYFWILGSVFGFWEMFWILGSVFGFREVFWILGSVLSLWATILLNSFPLSECRTEKDWVQHTCLI